MSDKIRLRLYITGHTSRSEQAIKNLNLICKQYPQKDICDIEVIDVLEKPEIAEENKIIATPTLVRLFPLPTRRIIGDLSDREKVFRGLGLFRDPESIAGGK
jgi:circadian clock protein KaiB